MSVLPSKLRYCLPRSIHPLNPLLGNRIASSASTSSTTRVGFASSNRFFSTDKDQSQSTEKPDKPKKKKKNKDKSAASGDAKGDLAAAESSFSATKKKPSEPTAPALNYDPDDVPVRIKWRASVYCPDQGKYTEKDKVELMRKNQVMWRKYMGIDDKACPIFRACNVKDDEILSEEVGWGEMPRIHGRS